MICTKGNLCPTLVGRGGGGGGGREGDTSNPPNNVSMQAQQCFCASLVKIHSLVLSGSGDADGGPLTISTKSNISVHRLCLEGYQDLSLHCLNRLTTLTFSDNIASVARKYFTLVDSKFRLSSYNKWNTQMQLNGDAA